MVERLSHEEKPYLVDALRRLSARGRGEALFYEVVGVKRGGRIWKRATPVHLRHEKEDAITEARRLLDGRELVAATVQGRGSERWPTPASEIIVYRGVAPGFSDEHFFAVELSQGRTVETR